MVEQKFHIVFKGKIVRGVDPAVAQNNLAKLFKLPAEKVSLLFDGSERVLKKSLPMDKANQYRSVLKKAGIKVALVQDESAADQADGGESGELTLSEPGVVLVPQTRPAEVHIETGHLQLGEAGTVLVEGRAVQQLDLDISHLGLDEPGVVIVDKEIKAAPTFDLSQMQMDEPGVILVKAAKPPAPEISIEGLSMEEVGATLVDQKDKPKADIDTSHIKLEHD